MRMNLTKVGTSHEVIPGVFWIGPVHLSSYGVEPGEVVSMETVVVFQPAKSGGAGRQVGPCLGLHRLCAQIIHVNILSCGENVEVIVVVNLLSNLNRLNKLIVAYFKLYLI